MNVSTGRKAISVLASAVGVGISLLAFLTMMSCGRAEVKCLACRYGQMQATYRWKDCRDLPDGSFECKHVVFRPVTVKAK